MIQDINNWIKNNIGITDLEKIQRLRKDCQVRKGKIRLKPLGVGLLIQDLNKEAPPYISERIVNDDFYEQDSTDDMDKLEQDNEEEKEEE